MYFDTIHNLLLCREYDKLSIVIKDCKNKLFKRGIIRLCKSRINNKENKKYNVYFNLLNNNDNYQAIEDLMKINDEYSSFYLAKYYFNNQEYDKAKKYLSNYCYDYYLSYLGQIAMEENNLEIGIEYFKRSKSSVLSSFFLGNCYINGYGVNKDLLTAIEYYKYGSNLGHPESMYALACIYLGTSQIEYGPKYCLDLMKKAALKMHILSFIYVLYHYQDRNIEEYKKWLEIANNSNNDELKIVIANQFKK